MVVLALRTVAAARVRIARFGDILAVSGDDPNSGDLRRRVGEPRRRGVRGAGHGRTVLVGGRDASARRSSFEPWCVPSGSALAWHPDVGAAAPDGGFLVSC